MSEYDDAGLIQLILEVEEDQLNDWERIFVESVAEWADTHALSLAQREKCEQIIKEKWRSL